MDHVAQGLLQGHRVEGGADRPVRETDLQRHVSVSRRRCEPVPHVLDERTQIARLETKGNYPHNGLSGFAFDFAGNVYFGLGENLGTEFKLIGTDGSVESNVEGGQIYRLPPDGSSAEEIANTGGFVLGIAFSPDGKLLASGSESPSSPTTSSGCTATEQRRPWPRWPPSLSRRGPGSVGASSAM